MYSAVLLAVLLLFSNILLKNCRVFVVCVWMEPGSPRIHRPNRLCSATSIAPSVVRIVVAGRRPGRPSNRWRNQLHGDNNSPPADLWRRAWTFTPSRRAGNKLLSTCCRQHIACLDRMSNLSTQQSCLFEQQKVAPGDKLRNVEHVQL